MAISYALLGSVSSPTSLADETFESEVESAWFSATLDRKRMKQLMQRSDSAGLKHFGVWGLLLVGSLVGVIATWLSWATVPFLLIYGLVYAMSDHHAHELSHGTPFKNRKINEPLYFLNAFMTLHEAHYWRWSHTRHHTDTMLVGRDPEIAVQRPTKMLHMLLDFAFLRGGWGQMKNIARISFSGKVTGDGALFVPPSEVGKVVRNSRIYFLIFALVPVASFITQSWLPLVLVVTPRFWGGFFAQLFNITQHAGLPENVRDHRLNTRTVLMNPIFRFMYMNMNFHVEHHMFPMVPFHALPTLHAEMADQCVPPSTSVLAAWRELLPAVLIQRKDPAYFITRELPGLSQGSQNSRGSQSSLLSTVS
jgi:fatty acid desaturase